jgi:hypothetical protein
MPVDKSIFGLRFGSNAELQPTAEELRRFLASPKKPGKQELHAADFAAYFDMLDRIDAFERERRMDPVDRDVREKMFFGVLHISHFFNASLLTAIEQYKYQFHALRTLDFRKPTVFIKSAEEEIGGLNPKKTGNAAKIAKLQSMIEERKRTLEVLELRRRALTDELLNITRYIRDNLVRIEKLCEGSIVILVDFQISGKAANRLVEDIREELKEQFRDSRGRIDQEHARIAEQEAGELSKELSSLFREDVYSLTGLFEAIHDHTKKIAGDIDALTAPIKGAKSPSREDERSTYEQLEEVLVSLVSDFRFELKDGARLIEAGHASLLMEKRKELLDSSLELLQKERRVRSERRSKPDRRKFKDPHYKGPERRQRERRSGRGRR